jgi:hypothetical protein
VSNHDHGASDAELASYRLAQLNAVRTNALAVAQEERLTSGLEKFRRDLMIAALIGVVAVAISFATILLYRHSVYDMPTVTLVCCSLGLLGGLAQLTYVAYQVRSGITADTARALKLLADLAGNAQRYLQSIDHIFSPKNSDAPSEPERRSDASSEPKERVVLRPRLTRETGMSDD